ncbi:MAG: uracil-DNA glycosylase [Acidimicrobiales bacterium]
MSLGELCGEIAACRACPRLVAWREEAAAHPRAAFRGQRYWGRPVPGFGDPAARLVVVGLAPAAHGGNRTGRMFTGDRSGDWLFAAMWRAGYASQPTSVSAGDGLALDGAWVCSVVRCAPPANQPTPAERETCVGYLARELSLLAAARVVVVLGAFAYESVARLAGLRPRPRFGHLVEVALPAGPSQGQVPPAPPALGEGGSAGGRLRRPVARTLLCSYHPSQRNTFTGLLTEPMLDAVFARARELGA